MKDLIDRQAAIRWVKTECNPYGKPTLDYESGKKVIEHLKRMQSAQPEQRWIPVTEKLPEDSNFYIVTHKDFLVAVRWYSVLHGWEWREEDQPIAWMSLPKPYREEEHDATD